MSLTVCVLKYKIFFMISVENLTKIYKEKKFSVTALGGVSFTLPDAGMVFVVGKSGSGKSTLLNMLGGLDSPTSGEIVVDGLKFSDIKTDSGFDSFRNLHMGFIFQDFHLIGRLNVQQNVQISLDLAGKNASDGGEEKVRAALEKVGLEGYEGRYPAEMSGGQQQRVAIARAIVKEPRLILADEPTGNLDSVTSKQILDLLKELSKDRLVVVVSHSMDAANSYADRVIELGDGRVVRDVTRVEGEDEVVKEGAILIGDNALSDGDIQKIDEAIKQGKVTSAMRASKFKPTKVALNAQETDRAVAKLSKPARLPLKRTAAMSFKFLRKGGLFASVVVATFLIVLFVICMTLYFFDGGNIIKDAAVSEGYPIIFQQQNEDVGAVGIKIDRLVKVSDEAEAAFRDAGYEGNIYKLVNMGSSAKGHGTSLEAAKMKPRAEIYQELYATEGLGVLIADEEYLHKYFGDFKVLSGALDAAPYGIIITDYFADSLLYYDHDLIKAGADPYAEIVSKNRIHNRFKVNAVIETGYKQTYADLFEGYKEILKDGIVTATERNELTGSDAYMKFLEDAQSRLNIAYTINPDFLQAVVESPKQSKHFARLLNSELEVEGKVINDDFGGYGVCANVIGNIPELQRGEAYVSINFYNSMFGTNFTSADIWSNFEQKSFTVREYSTDDILRQRPLYEKTFTVKGIYGQNEYMYISDEDFREMRQYDVFPYALVLDDTDDIDAVMQVAEELDLLPNATLFSDLLLVTKVLKVYRDVFLAMALVLLGAGFLVLVGFSVKSVGGRTYEIGILRALGASEGQVMGIFVLQTLFAGLLICVLEVAAQLALLSLTNGLLTASLAAFMHNGTFKGMTLLAYDPAISLLSLVAMAAITFASVIFPLIKLSRIKPMQILRKND